MHQPHRFIQLFILIFISSRAYRRSNLRPFRISQILFLINRQSNWLNLKLIPIIFYLLIKPLLGPVKLYPYPSMSFYDGPHFVL